MTEEQFVIQSIITQSPWFADSDTLRLENAEVGGQKGLLLVLYDVQDGSAIMAVNKPKGNIYYKPEPAYWIAPGRAEEFRRITNELQARGFVQAGTLHNLKKGVTIRNK